MDKVHFSTGKDDWGTPQDLFEALNKKEPEKKKRRRQYDRRQY